MKKNTLKTEVWVMIASIYVYIATICAAILSYFLVKTIDRECKKGTIIHYWVYKLNNEKQNLSNRAFFASVCSGYLGNLLVFDKTEHGHELLRTDRVFADFFSGTLFGGKRTF